MATIRNDGDLRRVLERLSPEQQRSIGARFIEDALDLCDDPIIRHALQVAKNAESSDEVRKDAFHSAKAWAVRNYTECGRDTDWTRQAAHFIGVATACLLSDEQPPAQRAWRVAMQVRNARNCAAIAEVAPHDINDEAERQRRAACELLEH
jgi:hypothetical protein